MKVAYNNSKGKNGRTTIQCGHFVTKFCINEGSNQKDDSKIEIYREFDCMLDKKGEEYTSEHTRRLLSE